MTVKLARPRKSYGLDGHSDLCAWVNSTHAPSLFARTKSFLFCHSLFLAVSLNCRFEPSLPLLLVAEDELFITFNCLTSTFVLHLRPDARERETASVVDHQINLFVSSRSHSLSLRTILPRVCRSLYQTRNAERR